MYYKFNDSNLGVSFIKELLHNFNLPKCSVLKDKEYKDKLYIKDHHFYMNGVEYDHYIYGKEYINITEKLQIKNMSYDIKTHNWLGEYLRFYRDFKGIDLMPLYNCFGKMQPKNLALVKDVFIGNNLVKINFNSEDTDFNYFIVPVKFNQLYTIALTSNVLELSLLLYDNVLSNDYLTLMNKNIELIQNSYQLKNGTQFSRPFIFSTFLNENIIKKYIKEESILKILIKIPAAEKTSITILEGDFTNSSPYTLELEINGKQEYRIANNFVDYVEDNNSLNGKPLCSLLELNTGESYPFATKLISYLSDVVVKGDNYNKTNIESLQNFLYGVVINKFKGVWDDNIKGDLRKVLKTKAMNLDNKLVSNQKTLCDKFETSLDLLYYLDKDLEDMLPITKER